MLLLVAMGLRVVSELSGSSEVVRVGVFTACVCSRAMKRTQSKRRSDASKYPAKFNVRWRIPSQVSLHDEDRESDPHGTLFYVVEKASFTTHPTTQLSVHLSISAVREGYTRHPQDSSRIDCGEGTFPTPPRAPFAFILLGRALGHIFTNLSTTDTSFPAMPDNERQSCIRGCWGLLCDSKRDGASAAVSDVRWTVA